MQPNIGADNFLLVKVEEGIAVVILSNGVSVLDIGERLPGGEVMDVMLIIVE